MQIKIESCKSDNYNQSYDLKANLNCLYMTQPANTWDIFRSLNRLTWVKAVLIEIYISL